MVRGRSGEGAPEEDEGDDQLSPEMFDVCELCALLAACAARKNIVRVCHAHSERWRNIAPVDLTICACLARSQDDGHIPETPTLRQTQEDEARRSSPDSDTSGDADGGGDSHAHGGRGSTHGTARGQSSGSGSHSSSEIAGGQPVRTRHSPSQSLATDSAQAPETDGGCRCRFVHAVLLLRVYLSVVRLCLSNTSVPARSHSTCGLAVL